MEKTITFIRDEVSKLMDTADSGHSMDHIDRVVNLAMTFAKHTPANANKDVIRMIALLHDADDYKLFGQKSAICLTNSKNILNQTHLPKTTKDKVIAELYEIGFNKRLNGVHPSTIESMLVSDADMCDAMGMTGILRVIQHGESKKRQFFDAKQFPRYDITYNQYMYEPADTTMGIIFEKLLWQRTMILTAPACKEVTKRFKDMVWFLRTYFKENGHPEWNTFLTEYVRRICQITGEESIVA